MPALGNPTPPLVGGNSVRQPILEGYVFQSGIHDPEFSKILTFKYPQYYMTALLDKLGASEPTAQSTFEWAIMDRTRESGTVSSLSATGSTTITFEVTEWDYTSSDLGYAVVGDVFRTASGALGRVTTIAASTVLSNKMKITLTKVSSDGTGTWGSGDIANTQKIGHVYNSFAEGSSAPNGRLFLPVEDKNVTTIMRRSVQITGSEFTNRTRFDGGKAWYWTVEDIMMKEFAKDREQLVMFGQLQTSGVKNSRGILDWVSSEGVINTYASSVGVSEADIQGHIEDLLPEGGSSEYLVLCGARFLSKAQQALRDYQVHSTASYSQLGTNMAGLNFKGYQFLGKNVYFVYYELFNDTAVLPFTGTPTSTITNFNDFSLWLDMGSDSSGRRLITLKYKNLEGSGQRKFIHTVENGMMSPQGDNGGFVSSSFDGFSVHLLSEIGIEVRLANRMGILRANS